MRAVKLRKNEPNDGWPQKGFDPFFVGGELRWLIPSEITGRLSLLSKALFYTMFRA